APARGEARRGRGASARNGGELGALDPWLRILACRSGAGRADESRALLRARGLGGLRVGGPRDARLLVRRTVASTALSTSQAGRLALRRHARPDCGGRAALRREGRAAGS